MKHLLLLVLFLLTVQGEAFSATEPSSSKSLESQLENTCAGQVMSLAATVRMDKSGKLKKHAFSDQTDSTFFWYFKKIKTLVEAPNASDNKKELQKVYGDLTAFARKKTPKTMDSCLKFLKISTLETQKVCGHLKGNEADFALRMRECTDKAVNTPYVLIASEEWKLVQKKLIFK